MKYQKLYNIVFSDNRSWRWKRHFLFWLAVFFYHMLRIGIMMPAMNTMHSVLILFQYTIMHAMIVNTFLTYSVVYFLVPKYFNRRRYFFFVGGILLVILFILSYYFIINWLNVNSTMRHTIGLSNGLLVSTFRPGFIRAFGNPPLITGLFLSLKILKNWHLEQLKTETLAKENTHAELQLLKAQVHPHFLFNTLNNIYSFSLNQSPQAGALLQKLSDMLNYMIHECEQPLVTLDKEIKLIQDYIGLEKVRYGTRLNLQLEIEGDFENRQIAPLLLIPFVENSFKHGASVMRGEQWIQLRINVNRERLDFYLANSKPLETTITNHKKGIGLQNVHKRLQLLYPDNYFLNIESANDTYKVQLAVNLLRIPDQENPIKLIPKLQPA